MSIRISWIRDCPVVIDKGSLGYGDARYLTPLAYNHDAVRPRMPRPYGVRYCLNSTYLE
ncbi:MAG: hypothetical protein IRZ07_05450 [Microbispora sp.]|nr:hypothetical protein [Microbispora sp.]